MKRSIFTCLVIASLLCVWTISNALAFQVVTREMFEKEIITEIDLIRTVDNFIVLFDTSSSTNQMVPGTNISKIKAAKDFLKARNEWLPDLGYKAGLYNYTNFKTVPGTNEEIYGVQPYDRDRFATAIDKLPEKGQGPADLIYAMVGLRKTLAGLTGKTTVIIFTDGIATRRTGFKRPAEVAEEIAREHDVNFYVISSATGDAEKMILETVVQTNASSRVVPLKFFLDNPHYIGGALYTVKATSYVRLKLYTQVVGFNINDILFDVDSAAIRSEYNEKLSKLADFLQNNPNAWVLVAGFSDSVGPEEHNLAISERRVTSVKDYLVDNHNIHSSQIVAQWFGELNPVGDNSTIEGRQLNRRVGILVRGID